MSPIIRAPLDIISTAARIIACLLRTAAWILDPSTPPPWATTARISRLHNRRHNDKRKN